jgi:sarcosine oxidase subunit beta
MSMTVEETTGSTLRFLEWISAAMIDLVPRFADLKVVRQWAGPYDVTDDGNPILGEAPGVPGFYLCCGFVGHGFMMAPVIGKYYAEWLAGGAKHEIFDLFTLDGKRPAERESEVFIIG